MTQLRSCPRCGDPVTNPAPKFCKSCGFTLSDLSAFDAIENLKSYEERVSMLWLDGEQVDESILQRLQSRLKISKSSHELIVASIERQVRESKPLSQFKLEFDTNVKDAVADGDTLLRFRFTNLSESEQLRVSLYWDDPEAPDELDFRIASRGFVKPRSSEVLMQSHIFRRAGRKSIQGVEIHVSNLFQDSARFLVSPFEFSVSSPTQTVVQHTTTNTSISIEGRGVVDASGIGTKSDAAGSFIVAGWDYLIHTLKIESVFGKVAEQKDLETLAATIAIAELDNSPSNKPDKVKGPESVQLGTAVEPQRRRTPEATGAADRGVESAPEVVSYETDEPQETSLLRTKIESFLRSISAINAAEGGSGKRVISSADWGLSLVRQLTSGVLNCTEDLIVGAVFSDQQSLRVGTRNNLESFEGDATVFTENGISIVNAKGRSIKLASYMSWSDADQYGINVYTKRFGPSSFIIEFGDPEAKVPFPGCQFDLRQYRGKPTSTDFLEVSRRVFTDICSLYQENLNEAPEDLGNGNHGSIMFADHAGNSDQTAGEDPKLEDIKSGTYSIDQKDSRDPETAFSESKLDPYFIEDLSPQLRSLDEKLVRFFQLFGFCMQGCVESSPRSVFTRQAVDPNLWDSIYHSLQYRGYPLLALCLEPQRALVSQQGRLSGWVGPASGVSVEGVFHLLKDEGEVKADGENYFLPWATFFGGLKASIFIREVGPDVWLGAPAKFFIHGAYRDYSDNVMQWDYFQEFIKRKLIELFDEIRQDFI